MLLEAYGITECSPMISGNRPGAIRAGSIGRPIDGYEILIVHPESMRPVARRRKLECCWSADLRFFTAT